MSQYVCDSCHCVLSTKYVLKTHIKTNKACLALRNLEMQTEFKCLGCEQYLIDQSRLKNHYEICKPYQIHIISEKIKTEYEEKMKNMKLDHDQEIKEREKEYQTNLKEKEYYYLQQMKENENRIMKEMYEKMLSHNQHNAEQLKDIATEAINKPTTTTTNHVHGNIRNIFSSEYTVDNINQNEVKTKCQAYLTEEVFFQGQKGIAHLCSEHIIKTKDKKQLLTCTDTSRKKFKHMDENGNIKEDAEARTFLQKVAKPIKEVSRVVYDSIISDVEYEQEQLKQEEEMDYSRKSILSEKFIRAGSCLMEISNMDDVNFNKEFTSELAILTK